MRKRTIGVLLAVGLLSSVLIGGSAAAGGGDPLAGTWHERDGGTSNLFWFVDEPVGDVYHVLFYDDFTGPAICDVDNGPMLWSGFATASAEANTIEGTFGRYWCPATSEREALEYPNPFGIVPDVVDFAIVYFPESDTITGSLFGTGDCVGSRQPHIKSVAKAIQELNKGMFPPSGIGVDIGCGNVEDPTMAVSLPSGNVHGDGFTPFHDEAQYQIDGAGWIPAGQVNEDGSVEVLGVASDVEPGEVVEVRIEGDFLLAQLTIVDIEYVSFSEGTASGTAALDLQGHPLFVCWDDGLDPGFSDCTEIEIGEGVWEAITPSQVAWTNFIQFHDEEGDIQEVIYTP